MASTSTRLIARIALAAIFALAATAVSAQDVGYNAMPGADFTKFKTYKWVKIDSPQAPDDITDAQIKAAIDAELATKGLTKSDSDDADLFVGYQVAISQERQWNAYNTGGGAWGWGGGYHGYGYGGGMATATSSTINIGTLGFDMYDRAAKQLVWRGKASKTLDTGAKPDKRAKNLAKGIKKLLKNYPPPVKK